MPENNEYNPSSVIKRWATDSMPKSAISQCSLCKHARIHYTCDAFPEGIPEEIQDNLFIHNVSYPNDNGIMYEASKEENKDIQFKPLR